MSRNHFVGDALRAMPTSWKRLSVPQELPWLRPFLQSSVMSEVLTLFADPATDSRDVERCIEVRRPLDDAVLLIGLLPWKPTCSRESGCRQLLGVEKWGVRLNGRHAKWAFGWGSCEQVMG